MTDWTGIATVVGALTVLVGAITTAALTIIKALRENTATVQANTADREVKTAATSAALAEIGSQVRDLHAGTDSGTTVIMPPAPEPPIAPQP